MKKPAKLLLLAFFVIYSLPFFGQTIDVNSDENTWLWEISGNGLEEPSYLYGGIRILCDADFTLSENLKQKFALTRQLVLEIADSDNPKTTFSDIEALIMKGKKLKNLFTAEEYAEVKKVFKDSFDIDLEDGFNPNVKPLHHVVSAIYKMVDCSDTKKFDTELRTMARIANKEIFGIETSSQQSHHFDSVPYDVQAKALLRLVREWESEKQLIQQLIALYNSQSFTKSDKFIPAWLGGSRDLKNILIDERNKLWLPKIKLFAAKKPTFFGIGAGHICGENGLVALLRAEGYTLTPLKN